MPKDLFNILNHSPLLSALVGLIGGLLLSSLYKLWRTIRRADTNQVTASMQTSITALIKSQAEMQGRLQSMAEIFSNRQAELNQSIRTQIDHLSHNMGQSLHTQTQTTYNNLQRLQERLAVIDTAQHNIQTLASQVVQLQVILNNKQSRGAFGQGQMEAIIADALPKGAYQFQATLSNKTRPDCIIHLPNCAESLVIDAKFPLEAWNAMRKAQDPLEKKEAAKRFRYNCEVHIRSIEEKYFIKGETQDTAFLFVPSESIFATLHEDFNSVIERAHKARIIVVSPSLLVLSIQLVQTLLKDAHMRENAHLIQTQISLLMQDINRLDERARKLHGHFKQTHQDIEDILTSSNKIQRHAARLTKLEVNEQSTQRSHI